MDGLPVEVSMGGPVPFPGHCFPFTAHASQCSYHVHPFTSSSVTRSRQAARGPQVAVTGSSAK